jgi:hypothetical protein
MLRVVLLTLFATLATGAGLAQEPRVPVLCEHDAMKSEPTAEQDEARCLAQLKRLTSRNGGDLHVALNGGKPKLFRDDVSGCEEGAWEKCITFQLAGYHPIGRLYLVVKSYYEGYEVLVVGRGTGGEMGISTVPSFSPSGRYFVSIDATELGDRKYDIAIWSIGKQDLPKLEWQYQTPRGDPYEAWEFVGWDGDERIKLKVSVNPGNGMKDFDADAVRTARGWQLNRPKFAR